MASAWAMMRMMLAVLGKCMGYDADAGRVADEGGGGRNLC